MGGDRSPGPAFLGKIALDLCRWVDEYLHRHTVEPLLCPLPPARLMDDINVQIAGRIPLSAQDRTADDYPYWLILSQNVGQGLPQRAGKGFIYLRPMAVSHLWR